MTRALDRRLDELMLAAGAAAAVVLGLLLARSPVLAVLGVGALGVAVVALRVGLLALTGCALAVLPWFVVLEGVAPALLATLIAAAAAGGLLWLALPLRYDTSIVPIGAAAFVVVVLLNAALASDSEQLTQAAKYIVFATVVLALGSTSAREFMPRLRTPLLVSSAAAMLVHLMIIAAGIGSGSDYYGTGERLGLAADGPHQLALLATIVAAAGLTLGRTWLQIGVFGLGAVPALLTGVRSALLGLALALGIYVWRSRKQARTAVVLVAIGVIAIASGALDVVGARFEREAGEFASFSGAGSGRGRIWTVAIEGWQAAGPTAWVFGAGLRSVVEFEVAALAIGLVGHSDLVEVLVQLGVVGFLGWVALWAGLLRAGLAATILVPVLAFGVVNGSLEYVAALTFGLSLAAALARPPDRAAA